MAWQSQNRPDPTSPSPVAVESGEANLAFYMQDRFAPLLNRINANSLNDAGYRGDFVRGELLESFLWLHHGVEIGYFPRPLSRRVTYEYFHLLLRAYESVRFQSYFETWFTVPVRAIFESEFTGNLELFSSGRIWQSSKAPAQTEALLQPCLVLANEFVQNPKARLLMRAVALWDDSEWDQAIWNNLEIEKVEEATSDEKPEHWTYPGFFSLLQYMRAFRTTKVNFGDRFNDPSSQDYLRLLKETQQWRLNFSYAKYRQRFMQVARMAAETYSKQLSMSQPDDTARAVAEFLQIFYDLTTDWGSPLVRVAGA